MNRKPSNPIPWLIGGLGIIVVGGLVYFNMSTKQGR
jgi:amino acid transporter